jgi:acyl-CoA synthetase (AMP-forming)/AMP-acid ligase II
MFALNKLPEFTFIAADGSEDRCQISQLGESIAQVSGTLVASLTPGSAVGLLFSSGLELVVNWLGCIQAGMKPLVLPFPNRRQNRAYLRASVLNAIDLVDLKAVVTHHPEPSWILDLAVPIITRNEASPAAQGVPLRPDFPEFEILQLSSGTTGHRKAVSLSSSALARHVADFNEVLNQSGGDVIVSWLPLYHDMGFIACFIMPLILGTKVVMMDPAYWVQNPRILFDAIARHAGTICYMPNFGYEVMARVPSRSLPSMRSWVSCSEPISEKTSRKFLNHVGAPESSFVSCYAMAENVFAISLRRGIVTAGLSGRQIVSCGPPVPGVSVKIVAGEFWVKSPVSLDRYVKGDDPRDRDGYYPTGDLGEIIDGELYVAGRKHDVMIQAGRKFLLSDLDLLVNEMYPETRGRAAAIAIHDEALGTEVAQILMETSSFFSRNDHREIEQRIGQATGVEHLRVAFVPPRFLTKTTSGKINRRKSAADWVDVRRAPDLSHDESVMPVQELDQSFSGLDSGIPVGHMLDSLSITELRFILDRHGVRYDETRTLAEIRHELNGIHRKAESVTAREGIRIVSIGDGELFESLTEADLVKLGDRLGEAVTFEHVCVPPSPILLSDLIFDDYFRFRVDPKLLHYVRSALSKVRAASVLIVDDAAEMLYPPESVYGVLSHNLERDSRADLISVRWQNYSRSHDKLPLTVVRGADMRIDASTQAVGRLSDYLSIPAFRIANYRGFGAFTSTWDWRPLRGHHKALDQNQFIDAFVDWFSSTGRRPERRPLPASRVLDRADLVHFCSHAIRREPIDLLLGHFNRFCIAGVSASVPYIRKRLDAMNKPFVTVPGFAPDVLRAAGESFECLLICGAMGDFAVDIPAVALQHVGPPWAALNLERFGNTFSHLETVGSMIDWPISGEDWHYPEKLHWGRNREEWLRVRQAVERGELA